MLFFINLIKTDSNNYRNPGIIFSEFIKDHKNMVKSYCFSLKNNAAIIILEIC